MSHFGNPKNAFLLYFPIAFHINHSAGLRILWLASMSEWINAIFKWFLHGERPYWWIHETKWYHEENSNVLNQYHVTCETGPGSPSGHAMVTSAVLFVLVKEVIQPVLLPVSKSRWLRGFLPWLGYTIVLVLVCVSRCFIAAHFPHQVVSGTVAGLLLAVASYQFRSMDYLSLKFYLITSLMLLFVGLLIFLVIQLAGIDPFWSLTLAEKWCQNKDWIHLDTTLFAAIIRDASSLVGLGLGLNWESNSIGRDTGRHWTWKAMAICLSVGLMQGSQFVNIPQGAPLMFYAMLAVTYVLLVFAVVVISQLGRFHLGNKCVGDSASKNS